MIKFLSLLGVLTLNFTCAYAQLLDGPGDDTEMNAKTGFLRPGKLGVVGRQTGKTPPGFFYNNDQWGNLTSNGATLPDNPPSTLRNPPWASAATYSASAQQTYSRDIGIRYKDKKDRGVGRIQTMRFKWIAKLVMHTNVGRHNFRDMPTSTAVVRIKAPNQTANVWKISTSYDGENVTITLPGVEVPIPVDGGTPPGNIVGNFPIEQPSGFLNDTHQPGTLIDWVEGWNSQGKGEVFHTGASWAVVTVDWNYFIAEGTQQLSRKEAITFVSP